MTPIGRVHFSDKFCPKNDEGYFVFLGPDGMVGLSQVSCDAAFEDWTHTKAQPDTQEKI